MAEVTLVFRVWETWRDDYDEEACAPPEFLGAFSTPAAADAEIAMAKDEIRKAYLTRAEWLWEFGRQVKPLSMEARAKAAKVAAWRDAGADPASCPARDYILAELAQFEEKRAEFVARHGQEPAAAYDTGRERYVVMTVPLDVAGMCEIKPGCKFVAR